MSPFTNCSFYEVKWPSAKQSANKAWPAGLDKSLRVSDDYIVFFIKKKYGGQYLYIACYSWCFIVPITTSPRCIQNRFPYCDKFERHSTIHFKYSLFIFFKSTILINGLSRNAIYQEPLQHCRVLLQIPLLR